MLPRPPRDADRTSRILASLMAAAQEAKDNSRAAGVVLNLSPGLDNMVKAAQGAVEAARERVASLAPAGGAALFLFHCRLSLATAAS